MGEGARWDTEGSDKSERRGEENTDPETSSKGLETLARCGWERRVRPLLTGWAWGTALAAVQPRDPPKGRKYQSTPLDESVHGSIIHNSLSVQTTHMPFN